VPDADVLGEEVKGDQAEPVDRRGDRQQRAAHRDAVQQRPAAHRRDDPDGQADRQPHDHGADGERDRGRQAVGDLLADRRVVLVAVTEIEVQDHLLHIAVVLRVNRLVQAEVVPDLLDELRAALAAGAQHRGVRRRQRVEDQEGHRADHQQQQDHPEQSADDVTDHRCDSVEAPRPPRAGGETFRYLDRASLSDYLIDM
jgi:hypothetical protein